MWERIRANLDASWIVPLILALTVQEARPQPAPDADAAGLKRQVEALREQVETLTAEVEALRASVLAANGALHTYELPEEIDLAGEPVPLDHRDVAERLEREFLLSVADRAQAILWLKRSARYFPYIESQLRKARLPDDLKYVAVIESALLPRARSHAEALGIWQFIAPTGRRYGLTITPWWDERRNPERSTRAALAYLGDLRQRFDDWPLALAGYNLGEERVERALEQQGVSSYYELTLPVETERYVLRVLAAKLILSDAERYGFHLEPAQLYGPVETDQVDLTVPSRVLVRELAEASGSFYREIKALNPEIVGDRLPKGRYRIRIPDGKAPEFASNRAALEERMASRVTRTVRYRVKSGDTLSGIAQRFGVSVSALRQWNPVARQRYLHSGSMLVIRLPAGR